MSQSTTFMMFCSSTLLRLREGGQVRRKIKHKRRHKFCPRIKFCSTFCTGSLQISNKKRRAMDLLNLQRSEISLEFFKVKYSSRCFSRGRSWIERFPFLGMCWLAKFHPALDALIAFPQSALFCYPNSIHYRRSLRIMAEPNFVDMRRGS